MENKISDLEDCIAEMQIKWENLKNEFMTAKCEVSILEKQLGKEREKLLKLREDKEYLLRKVQTNEEVLKSKNQTIERLQIKCKDLEAELSSEIKQHKKAENDNRESKKALKNLEMKHKKVEDDLRLENEQLTKKIETMQFLLEKNEQQNITLQDQQ
ncbi:hypothetical protein L9F63_016114 [Diploptera punctata]|uniref:Uncharacterized protein n=1 Tax=Diploptera punctata TaxID=6984 RepID=A0AAD8EI76_DIPPU|nr:hypothetical protein L9F63_016114 [Diploptera punctata]